MSQRTVNPIIKGTIPILNKTLPIRPMINAIKTEKMKKKAQTNVEITIATHMYWVSRNSSSLVMTIKLVTTNIKTLIK